LSVLVADTGHGMSRAATQRLGELLYTTKGEAGTGLGLWVTYQMFAKYGANVRVYSSTLSTCPGTIFRLCSSDTNIGNLREDRSTVLVPSSEEREESELEKLSCWTI